MTATGSAAYSYTDNAALGGVYFYRVRNVDTDGSSKYTAIVRVNLDKKVPLRAYPQPAFSSVVIEHNEAAMQARITLSSAAGQVVRSIAVQPQSLSTPVDLSGLQSGIYLVRFDNGAGSSETLKIVKQ